MSGELLRVAVIGTGAIGRDHMNRIQNKLRGAAIIACSDAHVENGKKAADAFGCTFFADGEEMIANPEIDAIVITTIDAVHEKYVTAGIRAGKYVFCEKPLALTAAECKRIIDAEITGGKRLVQVGFMRRYDPGYRRMKQLVDGQKFGQPLVLHCVHRNYAAPSYHTTAMSVQNSLIHEIDVLRWLLGEDYVRVEAAFPKRTRNAPAGLQDPQILYLTTASGIRIDIESFMHCRYGYDVRCEIVCEEGTINLHEPSGITIRSQDSLVTPICHDWSERFIEAYDIELQQWIDDVQRGSLTGPTCWDGYVAAVTATAGVQAQNSQNSVVVELEQQPQFYR